MYKIDHIAGKLLASIMVLPEGAEYTTKALLEKLDLPKDIAIDSEFLLAVDRQLMQLAKAEGIILDKSKYALDLVGMPYDIPFVVHRMGAMDDSKMHESYENLAKELGIDLHDGTLDRGIEK